MSDDKKKEGFLSYRRKDNDPEGEITEFHELLQDKLKLDIFFDKDHMENGDFTKCLRDAVTNCDFFIPIVSMNYVTFRDKNDWCKEELKTAIKNHKLIVPVFICDASKISEEYNIDTIAEKRTDVENIEEWDDADLIKYLTVSNGVTALLEDNTYSLRNCKNLIENCIKNIFNSFCSADQISFFHNLLENQNGALKQVSIQSTSYSFDMEDYIDLGITGKPLKAEIEEAERLLEKEQRQNRQKSLSDFLPNLNNFSTKQFIERLEEEKYAVVTGDAGQGKSIFLKRICMELGKQADENGLSRDKLFPIYAEIKKIPLPKDNNEDYSFLQGVGKASVIGITKEQIESVLTNGQLCLILDAMDEVSPDTIDNLFEEIKKASIIDKCYILLSSRPGQKHINDSFNKGISAELLGKTFRLWTVDNISDNNLDVFIKREASKNKFDEKDKEFINRFTTELKEKEKVDDKYKYMSRNPFMLKSIVVTYHGKGRLPKSKVEAFDQAVNDFITRELKGEKHPFSFKKYIIETLGRIAYNSYRLKDIGENIYINTNSIIEAIEEVVTDTNVQDEIYDFMNKHNLVDENGFSHDLFACYYCAFYLYRTLATLENKEEIENDIKNRFGFTKSTDYWKEVVETLICLLELNAKGKEMQALLETMLESMQTVVGTPDYDILCEAVTQFTDKKNNKPMGERVLIEGMLVRGERGIKSFNEENYKCSDGANPYEELFYYVVKNGLVLGLDKIFEKNKDYNSLSPIQTYLYNELCRVVGRKDNSLKEEDVCEFINQLSRASSKNRCKNKRDLKGHVNIDNNIKEIGKYTFYDCSELTSITMPDRVESIGNFAFRGCSGLTSIEIGKSVQSIGWSAFEGCSGLTSTTMPDRLESIGNYAFEGCSRLTSIEIGKSVQSIGNWAFRSCSGLTNIKIGSSVQSIGNSTFDDCSGLTSIEVSKGNIKFHSEGNCLIETKTNTLILGCKNSVIPEYVTNIGDYAFSGCSGLTSIEVPKGNTTYHSEGNCLIETKTKTLILGCKNSVIPNYIRKIGNYAFKGCSGLTSITIPDRVESITYHAFFECSSLTSIEIGKSVQNIGWHAIDCCPGLMSIEVSKGNIKFHSEGNCLIETKTKTLVLGCKNSVIPNYIRKIENCAFKGCSGLTRVTIPDGVESIGNHAFEGCSSLTNITIPDSVTSIEYSAFWGCSGLNIITIPDGVENIGRYAFHSCSGLTNITIPDSTTSIGENAFCGCKNLTYNEYDNALYLGNENNPYHALIKAKSPHITSCKIHRRTKIIYSGAFGGSWKLTSITIPDSITSVGENAFERCYALTGIEVTKGNTKFHSEGNCLIETKTNTLIIGCKNSVIPDYVTSIGDYAYEHCSGLTTITIPDSVKSIGDWAFSGCSGLTTITIPDSVKSIGDSAFRDCKLLTDIYFKGTKKRWGIINYVFIHSSIDFKTCTVHCIDGDIGATNA